MKREGRKPRPVADRFWEKVSKEDGCWLWMAATNEWGYGIFLLNGRPALAHRVAWMLATNEPPPKDMLVCHHCDTPRCVRPSHLFVGTNADNSADKVAKNRQARNKGFRRESYPTGADNPNAKLTEEQVDFIRSGVGKQRDVARLLGISKSQVGNIRRGESWRHP